MKEARIDTSLYTAHATRGAATSKGKAVGVPITEVQWSLPTLTMVGPYK